MIKQNRGTICSLSFRQTAAGAIGLILICVALMACDGGGSDGLMAGGGIGGTGISVGEISGFGSVVVNDVDYNTEKAEVIVNSKSIGFGDSTVKSALALGMVVRVEANYGLDGASRADRIVFTSKCANAR